MSNTLQVLQDFNPPLMQMHSIAQESALHAVSLHSLSFALKSMHSGDKYMCSEFVIPQKNFSQSE